MVLCRVSRDSRSQAEAPTGRSGGVRIWAIDPGPERSALVIYSPSTGRVDEHETLSNYGVLGLLGCEPIDALVIEQIAAMGMAVGAEVFETVFWSGRFVEAWGKNWHRVKRHEVKMHLCRSMRAKDANIRQAIIDRFGPGKDKAIGSKAAKGPLYGIHGDEWSALAVALTWADQHRSDGSRIQEAS